MRIKLISPKMSLRSMDSEFKRIISPPLNLLLIASLTPPEHSVYIENENTTRLNLKDRPDLVGITVNVDTSKRAYEIADIYRNVGVQVILGGIHVSSNPDEALQHADAVCIGEAEDIWVQIIEDSRNGCLQTKYQSHKPADLDAISEMRWDLVDRSRYLYNNIMYTSRGCPFQCEFCYNSCEYVHNSVRHKSVSTVIKEIEKLENRQIMFVDDNLIGDMAWARELVRNIKPLNLNWHAAVSTNIGKHSDLLDEMKDSGCQSLFIGFETICAESLVDVKKHQNNVNTFSKTIQDIHDRDIMVNASLVFGFDHDRAAVFRETLEWLVDNRVETMTAHILTPYPGTKLYNRLLQEGRIIDFDYTHYNTSKVVFNPAHMTAGELQTGYLWMYDEFYSLTNILKRIPMSHKQRIPYFLFNFGYRKGGKWTSRLGNVIPMNCLGRVATRLSYGM